jgi:site-specific DNA-methyltransferase (adenine-specific)
VSHVLHCGDGIAGMASLPDRSVDHVICDPPYEGEAHTNGRRIHNPRTKAIREAPLSFGHITEKERTAAAEQFARIARRWILVFCQLEAAMKWRAVLERGGARYIRTMVWVKPNAQPQLTGDRPGVGYECIVVAHSHEATRWNGGGARGWVEYPVDANFSRVPRLHETQKPLPMMEDLIQKFTDPGELVCDAYSGSATTGVACKRLGRRFVGWEIDPDFYEVGRKRLDVTREQYELLPRAQKPKQLRLSEEDKVGAYSRDSAPGHRRQHGDIDHASREPNGAGHGGDVVGMPRAEQGETPGPTPFPRQLQLEGPDKDDAA